MAMKELFYRLRPFQIYIVLALSIIYFFVQLFLSHVTHALTLLVDSYHMLCNIVALSGCITTIKVNIEHFVVLHFYSEFYSHNLNNINHLIICNGFFVFFCDSAL